MLRYGAACNPMPGGRLLGEAESQASPQGEINAWRALHTDDAGK